jgi:hypothetical protein
MHSSSTGNHYKDSSQSRLSILRRVTWVRVGDSRLASLRNPNLAPHLKGNDSGPRGHILAEEEGEYISIAISSSFLLSLTDHIARNFKTEISFACQSSYLRAAYWMRNNPYKNIVTVYGKCCWTDPKPIIHQTMVSDIYLSSGVLDSLSVHWSIYQPQAFISEVC